MADQYNLQADSVDYTGGNEESEAERQDNQSMVQKVKQSEQLDDGQKSEVLEKVIQEATAETRQQEEEMNQQQQEDDNELE